MAKAKERFKLPASVRALSCYEAGRDGFWLHLHVRSVGIENEVIDAASIEVNRRLRHVKADRLDGERLALEAHTPSHGRARRLERGARAERGGRGRQAPAPGASSV